MLQFCCANKLDITLYDLHSRSHRACIVCGYRIINCTTGWAKNCTITAFLMYFQNVFKNEMYYLFIVSLTVIDVILS